MPVAAAARELVQALIAQGRTDEDFAALLDQRRARRGVELEPEDVEVSDGLGELAAAIRRPPARTGERR